MNNYQVQYIRDRRALPITRDYIAEAEVKYREATKGPARKPRATNRAKDLETT
jgi:cyclopropane-fatty-acyl-phospholipid synthase